MKDKQSRPLIGVKMDRCWNRNWRCFMTLLTCFMAAFATYLWLKGRSQEPSLEGSGWKSHWSQKQNQGVAKKTVLEPQGGYVQVKEELFADYYKKMPNNDDSDYYDNNDASLRKSPSEEFKEYDSKYQADLQKGISNIKKPGSLGAIPTITDYSKRQSFKKMFRAPLDEKIEFLPNYKNPCWAESIKRYPYVNNSYLDVPSNFKLLDPQFQLLRQDFASRQDPSTKWRSRCLPYFYVMETPPFASPNLNTMLSYHPAVVNPVIDEPEFWNEKGPDGVATFSDYLDIYDGPADLIRKNFTSVVMQDNEEETIEKHKFITGDGTSSYLWNFNNWKKIPENLGESEPKVVVADLIKRLTPAVKIIIMLRNPTERLYEGYLSKTEKTIASGADFHNKVGQAMNLMSKCVKDRGLRQCLYDNSFNKKLPVRLRIGMYYTFLNDWLKAFPRDQILVLRYEDYVKESSLVISKVCSHLEIDPFPTADLERLESRMKKTASEKMRRGQQMMSVTKAMLKEFFKSFNEQLADLLGDDKFNWPELAMDNDDVQNVLRAQTGVSSNKGNDEDRLKIEQLQRETQFFREQFEKERKKNAEQQQKDPQQQQREQQQRDQQQREQQQREQQQREQQQREQQQREQQQRDQQQREQQSNSKVVTPAQNNAINNDQLQKQRDQQQKEQQQREQQQREQQQREHQQREQQQKEQQQREQQQREQQQREQQQREQQQREQQQREQQQREQQQREQQERDRKQKEQRDQQQRDQQQRDQQLRDQQQRDSQKQQAEQQRTSQQQKDQPPRDEQHRAKLIEQQKKVLEFNQNLLPVKQQSPGQQSWQQQQRFGQTG